MEKCRIFCEVQTGFLNVIQIIVGLKLFYTHSTDLLGSYLTVN
jgi:hypothetical protein